MTCPACTQYADQPNAGAYRFQCAHCCARLIKSARPLRPLQEAQIAALQRFHGPEWPGIWAAVKQLLSKP